MLTRMPRTWAQGIRDSESSCPFSLRLSGLNILWETRPSLQLGFGESVTRNETVGSKDRLELPLDSSNV